MKGYLRAFGTRLQYNYLFFFLAVYIGAVKPTIIVAEYVWPLAITLMGFVVYDIGPFARLSRAFWLNEGLFMYTHSNKKMLYWTDDQCIMENEPKYDMTEYFCTESCMAYQVEDMIIFNQDHEKLRPWIIERVKKWTKKEVVAYPKETFANIIKKGPTSLQELAVFLI